MNRLFSPINLLPLQREASTQRDTECSRCCCGAERDVLRPPTDSSILAVRKRTSMSILVIGAAGAIGKRLVQAVFPLCCATLCVVLLSMLLYSPALSHKISAQGAGELRECS